MDSIDSKPSESNHDLTQSDESLLSSSDEEQDITLSLSEKDLPQWINNNGDEVEEVFGFNDNAELVNGRAAMVGFIMLIITELAFGGEPAIKSIFGIG